VKRAVVVVSVVVVVAAAVFGGCVGFAREGAVELATDNGKTDGWDVEVARATRRVEPYDHANRLADLRATLLTPRLRKAFLDERARFHGRFAKDTHQELVGLGTVDEGVDATALAAPKSEEQVLVFVGFYASDQKNRDLAVSGSIWDTELVRGATRVKPVHIDRVRMSPAVVDIYPWVDRYDDLYLVRFPLVDPPTGTSLMTPGPEPLRLQVSSAIATASVSWSMSE